MMTPDASLSGRKILVVEDEFFICDELVSAFQDQGATIIGPAATVRQACDLIGEATAIDGAVLDINLNGQMSFPVADLLIARDIPFVFATGYDAGVVPPELARIIRCEKPVEPSAVARALFG